MANATIKPYAWLMPVEQNFTSNNNNNRELKEETETMRVKENDTEQTRQTFGEASFVKKSAPLFFRNLIASPVKTKNVAPVKETISSQQMHERFPPDVFDLSLSSNEDWMDELSNDDSEENKDKLPDEKPGAKDDKDVTTTGLRKEEKTLDEVIEKEKPATPPPTPEEIQESLSIIKEDEEFDSEDDGWDDYRAARATGSTSLVVEKPAESASASVATQVMDGSGDQNVNVVKAPTFGGIQSTGGQGCKEPSPKDDNPPENQEKDVHPIYFDFSQDDNEKLSADKNDNMLVATHPEESASDEDDGWGDYRAMNAHTSRNINNSNKAKETVNGEKMAAFGVIPEKMNELRTRNGLKETTQISDQMPFPFGSNGTSKNTLNCSGNPPVPDMWGPLVKDDNEQKTSNWAANEFFSKSDSAWNNALVRVKPQTRGPWRGNYGEFVPDLPKRESIDSKRQLFHQMPSSVFGMPSPQKPEKRIARESLQGFEKVLRMNKAVNSRRENKLAENAKKLFQRSKTPDFEPPLSQQYYMKPCEMKRVPYESLLSRTFTPSDASMMPKFAGKSHGMNDRFNGSHNNKVLCPMNFEPRRAQGAMPMGRLASSEMQEVAPSSRAHRIIEGTRRLFNNKEIRDFVRMTDQETYYMVTENLAFF